MTGKHLNRLRNMSVGYFAGNFNKELTEDKCMIESVVSFME